MSDTFWFRFFLYMVWYLAWSSLLWHKQPIFLSHLLETYHFFTTCPFHICQNSSSFICVGLCPDSSVLWISVKITMSMSYSIDYCSCEMSWNPTVYFSNKFFKVIWSNGTLLVFYIKSRASFSVSTNKQTTLLGTWQWLDWGYRSVLWRIYILTIET